MAEIQPHRTSSPVYDQVLALLRCALWGQERFPYRAPQDVEWKGIIQELKSQAVSFLAIDLLIQENPGKADAYMTAAAKSAMRWYNILDLQQEICRQLSEAGIPCVVAKGAAAAIYYPVPSGRLIGDIDLLVKAEDFEKACQVVSQGAEFLGETDRHAEYRRDNVVVELHRSFSSLTDPQKKAISDQKIFSAIDSAETVSLEEYSFRCLPQIENGLVLLEHISLHLENGLGLRQILDWMLFVDKVLDDRLWQDEFAPLLRELKLETLAFTVTRMCQMYLGLRADITWCADADEMLCQYLMEYILSQGNFGRKLQRGANRAVAVIGATKDLRTFFRILQYEGCKHWKAAEQFPFLKPFAWLYQLFRYIIKGIRTKNPLAFLRSAAERSKTQEEFLDTLGVRRISGKSKRK